LESLFYDLLKVKVDGKDEVISREGFNAPEGFDLSPLCIHFDLSAPIDPSEIGLPSILDPILPHQGTHSIRYLFGLFDFIFIDLSEVPNEMGSQLAVMIASPWPNIYKEAWEVNPVCFEKGKLIPINIRFNLYRLEAGT
jgi:hypothetical protein